MIFIRFLQDIFILMDIEEHTNYKRFVNDNDATSMYVIDIDCR